MTAGGAATVGCSPSDSVAANGGDAGGLDGHSAADGSAGDVLVIDAGTDADAGESDAPSEADGDAHTGPCVDTLEHVRNTWGVRCGDTVATDIDAAGAACESPGSPILFTSTCGGLDVVGYSWGTHDQYCFYPADGGTLVAATANDDVQSFCAHTSWTISAGPVQEVVDPHGGATTWSVSGQACDMAPPDGSACAHDAGTD